LIKFIRQSKFTLMLDVERKHKIKLTTINYAKPYSVYYMCAN